MHLATVGVFVLALTIVCCTAKPYSKKTKGHHVRSKYYFDDLVAPPIVPADDDNKKPEEDKNDNKWMAWNPVSSGKNKVEFAKKDVVDLTGNSKKEVEVPHFSDPCKNLFCHYGRVCEATPEGRSKCVCAGEDFCKGHKKSVCGSDGFWYPSHCELHRMACVKNRHITIDHTQQTCLTPMKKDHGVKVSIKKEHIDTEAIKRQDKEDALSKDPKKDEEEKKMKKEEKADVADQEGIKAEVLTEEPESQVDVACEEAELRQFKNNLLKHHCAIIGEADCMKDTLKAQFLANIMFGYYDHDNDDQLSYEELANIQHKDHLEKLSQFCSLTDILSFDDLQTVDNKISMDEFYVAFNIDTVLLDENLKVFTTQVSVGNSVELKCDIRGSSGLTWKRNGASLDDLTTNDIKVFEDGSLYLNNLGLHHMANYTCQDKNNDRIVQTHVLKVQMPPKVKVSPTTQFHTTGSSVLLQCRVDGVPEPSIQWEKNETPLPEDPEAKHYMLMNNNATLEIRTATYTKDTGAYKCLARNTAGTAQDIATVFIEGSDVPKYSDSSLLSHELFVVFHDNGYNIYEPTHCHMEHMVTGTYENFHTVPDYGSTTATLCEPDLPCSWGSAVNVKNQYIYISQPKLNRVVVVDVAERANPIEVIPTDDVPVSVHYVEHLDQVWVVCWNQDSDSGSKTAVVIRQASEGTKHHTVHTQPIGNRFDLIKELFTPPANDLDHKFQYGYVVHQDQLGLYKMDLQAMKYVSTIDLAEYQCAPMTLAFIPLGGKVVVHCGSPDGEAAKAQRLILDYVTDKVLEHVDLDGEPYLSPDTRYLVLVDNTAGTIKVNKVNDNGQLEELFEEYTNMKISDVSFFPSEHGQSYDLYASSATKDTVLYMDLASGKVEMVEGVGEPLQPSDWPWSRHTRVIQSGGSFGQYLMSPSRDAAVIIDGKRRHVQCKWENVKHANVVVWVNQQHL